MGALIVASVLAIIGLAVAKGLRLEWLGELAAGLGALGRAIRAEQGCKGPASTRLGLADTRQVRCDDLPPAPASDIDVGVPGTIAVGFDDQPH